MEIKDEVDRSLCLDKQTYYDLFSKKIRYINRYDDVVRLFVGNRILPIICNELNHESFSDYRELPVPDLKGNSVFCLANEELVLTPDTYRNYDIIHTRWPYLVLCAKDRNLINDNSVYRVIARMNYAINQNGDYELQFQTAHKDQYHTKIKQFKNKCIQLANQMLEGFIQTPLLQAIKKYDSVKEFAGAFPTDIDRKLYKKGLKNYCTYLESDSNRIELRLKKLSDGQDLHSENDDCFNLFDYDHNNQQHNLFFSNYLVTRNQWVDPVSYGQHKATPDEIKASKIFFAVMKSEFPTINIKTN